MTNGMTGNNADKSFLYPTEEPITLPQNGFLERLKNILEEKQKAEVGFNLANILTPEVIGYCLDRINSQHVTASQKAVDHIKLAELMLLDKRYPEQNAIKAKDFLIKHAPLISKGITRPATNDDFYRQSNVAWSLMNSLHEICVHVQDRELKRDIVENILEVYSSALGDFFHFAPETDADVYSDTRDSSAHLLMKVITHVGIAVPEFFQPGRLQLLKGMAQEAFDYVRGDYLHYKALLLAAFFKGVSGTEPNEIGTQASDPMHLVGDKHGNRLIVATNDENRTVYLYNVVSTDSFTKPPTTISFGLAAESVPELRRMVGSIRVNAHTQPCDYLNDNLRKLNF